MHLCDHGFFHDYKIFCFLPVGKSINRECIFCFGTEDKKIIVGSESAIETKCFKRGGTKNQPVKLLIPIRSK